MVGLPVAHWVGLFRKAAGLVIAVARLLAAGTGFFYQVVGPVVGKGGGVAVGVGQADQVVAVVVGENGFAVARVNGADQAIQLVVLVDRAPALGVGFSDQVAACVVAVGGGEGYSVRGVAFLDLSAPLVVGEFADKGREFYSYRLVRAVAGGGAGGAGAACGVVVASRVILYREGAGRCSLRGSG